MRWLVVDFGPATHGAVDAVWVTAETEQEAAQAGLEWLQGERLDNSCDEPVSNVYLVPAEEFVAYSNVARAERSELQCCGGLPPEWPGRHAAGCPEGTEETSGRPLPGPPADPVVDN